MPELLPSAILVGILTGVKRHPVASRAQKPGLSFFKVVLIGVAGAYLIPPTVPSLWRHCRTSCAAGSARRHIGAGVSRGFGVICRFFPQSTQGPPPRLPLWAGLTGLRCHGPSSYLPCSIRDGRSYQRPPRART